MHRQAQSKRTDVNDRPAREALDAGQGNQPGEPLIRVEGFKAAYGGTTILDDIAFEVKRGEVMFIAGGSGSGKSTLMKHMIGLHPPAQGRILIDGDDITTATGKSLTRIIRKFGVAYQSGALFGSMTVLENVKLPLEQVTDLPQAMIELIALTKMQLVGLASAAQMMPAELSGGMQKRAAIARALALDPALVFLDEPSAGLDPITSASLDDLIGSLNRLLGTTFVIVSHELASIFAVADRAVILDGAKKTMVGLGAPSVLREQSPDPWVRQLLNRQPPEVDPPADRL